MHTYTHRTRRALAAYGLDKCRAALRMNEVDGEGAYTVGQRLGLTTRQADAAIDAAREVRDCVRAAVAALLAND